MKTTPTLGLKLYDGTDAPDLVSGYNASMATLDGSRILCKRPLAGTDDLNDIKDTGYYNDSSNVIPANAAPGLTRPVCYIVLDTCTATGTGQRTTQIAVGTPVVGKDNILVRTFHIQNGWTEWLPVSAEQASSWAEVTGKPFDTVGTSLTTSGNVLDLSTAAQASLVPEGGAAGQVLSKKSNTDHDCVWTNPSALTNVLSLGSSVTISENHEAGEDFNNLVNAGVEVVTFNGGGAYPVFISHSLASGSASINNMPAIGAIAMANDISITITAILSVPKPQSTEILAIPLIITVRKAYKSVVQLSSNDAGYTIKGIRVTPFVYSIGEAS